MLGIQGSLKEMKDSGKLTAKADSDDEDFEDGSNRKGRRKETNAQAVQIGQN